MIIIEGTDEVGKTVFAKSLQARLKCAYVHYGLLPDWWGSNEYILRMLSFAVYDRYHWSEAAYNAVLQREPNIVDESACVAIDREIREVRHIPYLTILLYSSKDDYFNDKPDDMYDARIVKSVNRWFADRINRFDKAYDVTRGWPDANKLILPNAHFH